MAQPLQCVSRPLHHFPLPPAFRSCERARQIFTQIPTTLSSSDNSASQAATKRNVIAGTVGGVAFIILIIALFLFYRRHQTKKVSFFKRLQPKPRTRLLDGEDMDDFDLGTPMARYSDYPVSVASSRAHSHSHSQSLANRTSNPSPSPGPGASPHTREFHAASPGPSLMGAPMDPHRAATPNHPPGLPHNPPPPPPPHPSPPQNQNPNPNASPPHLLGMRSESGSIFREAVWPPPSENSTLVDPLRVAGSAVDLSRIVDDVMGPTTTTPTTSTAAASQRGAQPPPPSYRGSRTSDLLGDDPFASHSPSHSRDASDAPLLPKSPTPRIPGAGMGERDDVPKAPGSPLPLPKFGALFVTNMGPLSPSSTITSPTLAQRQAASSSPTTGPGAGAGGSGAGAAPRNWLQRSPKKAMAVGGARRSIDEDNVNSAVDVADVTSTGHGVGEAL
ncbi:hypothetical protein GSI_15645 [Ganoderma sinense ZZ0214-1]|uniref:Uncharacterized protein n=1 Tax=Ganoderma sinense ZZ0214-1 TaxID=1077348 RepID=A0A2G8RN64_9APHY|nr:hypothetical protein GSI_15645 [Ganoderma sinense ZZ0214-1]